jgi:hypothetical protein
MQCNRCGRELKDERSKKRGYGPKCYKKAVEGVQAEIDEYLNDSSVIKAYADFANEGETNGTETT